MARTVKERKRVTQALYANIDARLAGAMDAYCRENFITKGGFVEAAITHYLAARTGQARAVSDMSMPAPGDKTNAPRGAVSAPVTPEPRRMTQQEAYAERMRNTPRAPVPEPTAGWVDSDDDEILTDPDY